jgi:hypothetical protein
MKHTPGKWKTYELRTNEVNDNSVVDQNGDIIARVVYRISPGEQKANLYLLATAPELLEVLKKCVARIEFLEQYTDGKVDESKCKKLAYEVIQKSTS